MQNGPLAGGRSGQGRWRPWGREPLPAACLPQGRSPSGKSSRTRCGILPDHEFGLSTGGRRNGGTLISDLGSSGDTSTAGLLSWRRGQVEARAQARLAVEGIQPTDSLFQLTYPNLRLMGRASLECPQRLQKIPKLNSSQTAERP
jgi:hypothetical protein